jgi:hypothetical protein
MKKYKMPIFLALLLFLLTSGALAGVEDFSLPWWTVDSGGGRSHSARYTLNGSIAQPDAGVLSGGDYTLRGGFWAGGGLAVERVKLFLPLVMR